MKKRKKNSKAWNLIYIRQLPIIIWSVQECGVHIQCHYIGNNNKTFFSPYPSFYCSKICVEKGIEDCKNKSQRWKSKHYDSLFYCIYDQK